MGYLEQGAKSRVGFVCVVWGTRHLESLRDAFCGHVINGNVTICSDRNEFVAGVHDR